MDYQTAYDQAAPQYDPLINQINQQVAQIDPQQTAALASLDQAKVNAFKDITNQANAKGVIFSGVPIDQQSTYVGTKYLPAVANTKTAFQNQKNSLLGQINQLQSQRSRQAQLDVQNYAKAQADAAYKNAQLQLSYARLNNSNGRAAQNAQDKLMSQYQVKYKPNNAGYAFVGPNNRPLNLAQYVGAIGGDHNTVLDLLKASPSSYDQKVYKSIAIQLQNRKIGTDPNAILKAVAAQDAANYYGLK